MLPKCAVATNVHGVQEDEKLMAKTDILPAGGDLLNIVRLNGSHTALDLWEPLCRDHSALDVRPLLLLPSEYDFADASNGPTDLWKIATVAAQVGWQMQLQSAWHVLRSTID